MIKPVAIFILVSLALVAPVVSQGCTINRSPPVYKQCDPAWGSKKLGSTGTICKIGCLMTSVASGMAGAGKTINGTRTTPDTLNTFLLNNKGYVGNLFSWGAISQFGLKYEGQVSDTATIKKAVCDNKVVVINVKAGGHWVLVNGHTDSTFIVNDSLYNKTTYGFEEASRAGIYKI